MKGMLDFLEKAGLVTRDTPQPQAVPEIEIELTPGTPPPPPSPPPPVPRCQLLQAAAVANAGVALNLGDIYARAGIAPALYPAERLLRLVDGLSAMDAATRLMAINAMDAADDSWTMADPLADAAAKVAALGSHGESLKLKLQQLELETQSVLDGVLARQEKVVGDIRKQIAELEALVARELSRSAQETAEYQASLQAARDQTSRELAELTQVSLRLQSLSSQFGTPSTPAQD